MRRKQKRKRKLRPGTFLFFLLLAMLLAAVVYAGNQFREEVGQMAEYRSKIAAVQVVNDSIMEVMEEKPGLHLLDVVKNAQGEVVSIETDIQQISAVKTGVTDKILKKLKTLSRDSIQIPLGNLTGNGFLSARGPNIDCRFIPIGSIEIKTLSKFEACGINQTRHQIVLSVETEISAITSFKSVRVKVPTDFILAETVIVGSVPENYTQVLTSDRELVSEINDYKAGVQ